MITHQACPRKRVLSVPRQRVSLEGDFLYSQKNRKFLSSPKH
nr:MAG TPA: hypothetical protein [Caudoviricetes sp.]DAN27568.1 MAG TPA: hypothetical protein [Caudoviricetes sp.]